MKPDSDLLAALEWARAEIVRVDALAHAAGEAADEANSPGAGKRERDRLYELVQATAEAMEGLADELARRIEALSVPCHRAPAQYSAPGERN